MTIEQKDKSYRKPYRQTIPPHWWRKSNHYLFYIIRESTAFFMLWVSIILMYGVICAHTNEMGQDEFYRFIFFLQHPIVVVLNVLTLLAALIHSITWFNLVPKAINIVIANKKPPARLFIITLWLITIVISTALLLLILGYFG